MNSLTADDRSQVTREATVTYWKHIVPIVQIAFAIHVLLLGLFLLVDVPVMWMTNAVSVTAYIACLLSIRRRLYRCAGMLICIEVIIHAAIATWCVGWDSNFYLYVFCIVPIIAFGFHSSPVRRRCLNTAVLIVTVGGYVLRNKVPVTSISPHAQDLFGAVNALAATALLLHVTALSVRFNLTMHMNLYQSAHRDSLTNLYTRRRVLQRLRQLGGGRREIPTALVLIDIDHFKQINDQHGHDLGDVVLQQVADVIAKCVRTTDIAARWGGEEFLVLMPNTPFEDARLIAERILTHIREEVGEIRQMSLNLTATLAVATLQEGETFRDALNRADQRLYEGKQEGRNRVMLAE
ncbi:GGDEF domain-containing protein [Pseudomonas sp. KU26590]|uniref:GGDEF domain-containing protein n=1 Tax=Pseudomonas sp. KU26590 TaxID=2991051 RepID=UPI00223E8B89|nr:GGDEF domain-containing protein [Pseudomonas sp. KU26590]UZJ57749.1 GGDEF domain-containing protein [Pseudomonas sp. KU26590]